MSPFRESTALYFEIWYGKQCFRPRVLMYRSVSQQGDNDALCASPERSEVQMLHLERHNLLGVLGDALDGWSCLTFKSLL